MNWISRAAETATEPVTLAIWGGVLFALGVSLRGWSAGRASATDSQPLARPVDRRLASSVAQPVEG